MRRLVNLCCVTLCLQLLCCAATASDAKSNPDEGFVPLFNGKDLTGWQYAQTKKGAKVGKGYQVENGVIFATHRDGGALFTEKEYGDFILRFEFKLESNSNNGIGIRAPIDGDPAYEGMEIQVLDDTGSKHQNLRPEQYHGSIYDVVAAKRGHQKPLGVWNEEEITCKGSRITVKLNGHTIVDADLNDIKDEEILKKHPGLRRAKGHIGLLGHASRVDFRNLRIKEL